MQKQLLSKSDLTYEKAVELALSQERATQNVKDLKNERSEGSNGTRYRPQESVAVHRVTKFGAQSSNSTVPTCYRCGIRGHSVPKCRVSKDITCHACGKPGHLQRACKGRQRGPQQKSGKCTARTVCQVLDQDSELEQDMATLHHVRSKSVAIVPHLSELNFSWMIVQWRWRWTRVPPCP